jgi:hypothetical protein
MLPAQVEKIRNKGDYKRGKSEVAGGGLINTKGAKVSYVKGS